LISVKVIQEDIWAPYRSGEATMKVRDVMTSPVVSVGPDTPLLEAGELMLRNDISGLPVLDREARLVGLITERDFLRPTGCGPDYKRPRWFQVLAGRAKDEFGRQSNRKVADVMTARSGHHH
jgi:CBS domain-containing protein